MSGDAKSAPPAPPQGSTEGGAPASKEVKPPDQKAVTPPPPPAAGAPPKVEGQKEVPPPAPKAEEKKPDGTTPPPAVEVKYDGVKLAEGSTLKPEDVEAVKAYAKEQGLSEKQAQAMLDRESKAAVAREAATVAELATKRAGWQETTKKDPALGGEFLTRTSLRTKAALDRFDGAGELRKILDVSGLGDLPQVVRFLEGVGATMEDSKLVKPPPVPETTGEKKTDQDVFYKTEKKA